MMLIISKKQRVSKGTVVGDHQRRVNEKGDEEDNHSLCQAFFCVRIQLLEGKRSDPGTKTLVI